MRTDDEIRGRIRDLRKMTSGRLATVRIPIFPGLEPGDVLRFGGGCEHGDEPCEHDTVIEVDRIATLTCDGCGDVSRLPAQLMPPVLATLVLCARCGRLDNPWWPQP